jgi:hypothetical protein
MRKYSKATAEAKLIRFSRSRNAGVVIFYLFYVTVVFISSYYKHLFSFLLFQKPSMHKWFLLRRIFLLQKLCQHTLQLTIPFKRLQAIFVVSKSKSKSRCDWRSVSQYVLVSSPNLRLLTRDLFFQSYCLVFLGIRLWREVGSVMCHSLSLKSTIV